MESSKSYFTTQLKRCDYGSGSRCRYSQGRDDGRSLQEALNAFQGSFLGEHIGTEFPLLCTSEDVVQRGGERPDSCFVTALEVYVRSQFPLLSFKYWSNIHFHCFSLWVLSSCEQVHALGLPNRCICFHVGGGGMSWDEVEMSFYTLIPTKAKRDGQRCPRSPLDTTGRKAGATWTWVISGKTICQIHMKMSLKGPFCPAGHSWDDDKCSIPGMTQCPWHSWWKAKASVSPNSCTHQFSPETVRCSYQAGWLWEKKIFSKPQREGVKATGSGCKGVGGIRNSYDSRSKYTYVYM